MCEDYRPYDFYTDHPYHSLVVPKHSVWDGASIPKIAQQWFYTPFHPMMMGPSAVHDLDYQRMDPDGPYKDRVFYHMLLDNGVPGDKAWLMYAAVTLYRKDEGHLNRPTNEEMDAI